MDFKKGFIWGSATSSYQIEGGRCDRGEANWDVFCSPDGKRVAEGHNGDVACDHYHRMKQDVALMKEMGLQAYRFSISWPRVMPDGIGAVNQKGLDFYSRLVDELLANGIKPFVTLYHWDLPQNLQNKGGWLNNEIENWFADYTRKVVERLSDRVEYWITQNEPQCYIGLGYKKGAHAPGYDCSWKETMTASKNSMRAHGLSVKTIRQFAKTIPQIGYAPCGRVCIPLTESEADIAAARTLMFDCFQKETHSISQFVDPVILGKYPKGTEEVYGDDLPPLSRDDIQLMTQPLDFLGLNNYHGAVAYMGADGLPKYQQKVVGRPITSMDWDVSPQSIYWGFRFLYERYALPLFVTENGMANNDVISLDGKVYDYQRIDFMQRYLQQLRRAVNEGIDVKGYFHWSLMDNFEWAWGYTRRFGLIYVDYANDCKRTIKESGKWYRKVIESNGECL